MSRFSLAIETRDGLCPASLLTPTDQAGPWPAVLFFMDGFGILPAMWEMGQRLADGGYVVLLPDLYYRLGPYPPVNPREALADAELMSTLMKNVASLDRDRAISDTVACIEFLTFRPEIKGDRYGITGYCMGGNLALTAAGAFPGRFVSVASIHGGNLVTDEPDSPHHFVKHIRGYVYVASAVEDAYFTEDQKICLEEALTAAGVHHLVETYQGAHHGFAVSDVPSFDLAASDRHWASLFRLLHESFALEP
jgi:carboxymethylenebutenolidase